MSASVESANSLQERKEQQTSEAGKKLPVLSYSTCLAVAALAVGLVGQKL